MIHSLQINLDKKWKEVLFMANDMMNRRNDMMDAMND